MDVRISVNSLGELLYATAAERHMSGRAAAKAIGLTIPTYSRIVNGGVFRLEWVLPIARWCGLTPQQLWDLLDKQVAS